MSFRPTSLALAGLVLTLGAAPISFAQAPAGYESIEVTDGGTIRGLVTWAGDSPTELRLPVSKNPETCGTHGAEKVSPRLKISPRKGVKDAVVFLQEIARGKPFPTGVKYALDQKECEYLPHLLVVPKGADLEVSSSDDVLHNVHLDGANSGNLAFPDKTAKPQVLKMKKAGFVDVRCDNGHVWMNGTVLVITHPYYAVTDEEGRYLLADVPPGAYKLVAWHEGWDIVKKDEKDGVVTKYYFSEPVKLMKDVDVKQKGEAEVSFELRAGGK
ncbi:MAG: hypothetical protein HYZ53_12530 [Planctomycetes bacterium]|nr:hypothetical protein [Planctomycetota bacterium]